MNPSSIRQECIAGLTTLLSSLYIIFTIPLIYSTIGLPMMLSFVGTCITVGIATLWVGLRTNLPLMVGPGMALATFITTEIVQHLGFSLQQAFGLTILSGFMIWILTQAGAVKRIENTLSKPIKSATTIGIGLLFLLISIKLADTYSTQPHLTINTINLFGWSMTVTMIFILNRLKIPGSTLISMITATIVYLFLYHPNHMLHTHLSFSHLHLIQPTLTGLLGFKGFFAVTTLILVCFIDTTVTLHALLDHTQLLQNHSQNKTKQCLSTVGLSTSFSGLLNGSPLSIYLESAAGIFAGGKTYLTSAIVGIGFLLSLFLAKWITLIPHFVAASALTYIAIQMIKPIRSLPWKDTFSMIPIMTILVILPMSFSIANGVGAGIITYSTMTLWRNKSISLDLVILSLLFITYFLFQWLY